MTESEQPPIQPKRNLLAGISPWADAFSKAVAGIAIALYASGFLTVSTYHSQFGFIGTNPFRPRVLAAGAWFLFFTAIPISIAMTFRLDSWRKIGKNAFNIWVACIGLSFFLGSLLFDYTTDAHPLIRLPLWGWIAMVIVWVSLGIVIPSSSKLPEWISITASVLLTLLAIVSPLASFFRDEFHMSCLAVWYFGVSFVALVEFKSRRQEDLGSFAGWAKPMGVLLGALLIFSQYVYPHLKASWGGGTPANVTIYFSKDSLISPNKSVQAQLVEESDEGFYIVGPKESKAIFIPRSAVALMYFSDKAAESSLLQGIK